MRRASGSPASAAPTSSRPETLPSSPMQPARRLSGLSCGQLGGVALERLAGAVGLDAAAVGAVARAGRAVRVEREVAELGAEPVRAAEGHAADHDAAAHAGAEREHHEVVLAEDVGLGEGGAVGVVVDEHRHAEAAPELGAQRHAGQRDVHARLDRAGRVLDLGRDAHADRLGLPDPADQEPHGLLEPVEERGGAAEDRGALDRVANGNPVDRRHRDLGAAHVHSQDHDPQRYRSRVAVEGACRYRAGSASRRRRIGDNRPMSPPRGRLVGGLDLGGTKIQAVLLDGAPQRRRRHPATHSTGGRASGRGGGARRRAVRGVLGGRRRDTRSHRRRRRLAGRDRCAARRGDRGPQPSRRGRADPHDRRPARADRHARVRGERRDRRRLGRARARRGAAVEVAARRLVGHRRGRRDRPRRQALGGPRRRGGARPRGREDRRRALHLRAARMPRGLRGPRVDGDPRPPAAPARPQDGSLQDHGEARAHPAPVGRVGARSRSRATRWRSS